MDRESDLRRRLVMPVGTDTAGGPTKKPLAGFAEFPSRILAILALMQRRARIEV
jgi:hypothetical protein